MLTFLATLRSRRNPEGRPSRRSARRSPLACTRRALGAGRDRGLWARLQPGSESGVSLIEVVISALLVGLIVIGTLSGFDSAGRATGDERAHNQATLLAGQDEERLRGLNATELANLGYATRTVTENGTTFKITSQAQYVSASKEKLACEASEATADYLQTTSTVSWTALGSREPVKQSSIVAVPNGLSLLVHVYNQNHENLEGATVKVMNRSETSTFAQQTTPASGCVIFGALPEKAVNVTATVPGYINEAGETEPPAHELTLTPTALTGPNEFTIAAPGSLVADFESNGQRVGVTGDTIYATHTGFTSRAGGTAGSYTSSVALSGLYPFATPGSTPKNPYTVYAGDCSANEPATVATTPKVEDPHAQVEPNGSTPVLVEVPAVNVTVYEGSAAGASQGALDSKAEAKITNNECSKTAHPVKLTSTGNLEQKYQPYAKKLTLCVSQLIGSQRYKYSTEFVAVAKAGITLPTIYMSATANKSTSGC